MDKTMKEDEYFILVQKGCGRYAELRKDHVFEEENRGGLVVYRLVKHISTRSYYTLELSIEFREFLIAYAEREGITIDEYVLNNSIAPDNDETPDFVNEVYSF
jgi:hypothetical protein